MGLALNTTLRKSLFRGVRDRTREGAPKASKKLGGGGEGGARRGRGWGESSLVNPKHFIELLSSTNGEQYCNLID